MVGWFLEILAIVFEVCFCGIIYGLIGAVFLYFLVARRMFREALENREDIYELRGDFRALRIQIAAIKDSKNATDANVNHLAGRLAKVEKTLYFPKRKPGRPKKVKR